MMVKVMQSALLRGGGEHLKLSLSEVIATRRERTRCHVIHLLPLLARPPTSPSTQAGILREFDFEAWY